MTADIAAIRATATTLYPTELTETALALYARDLMRERDAYKLRASQPVTVIPLPKADDWLVLHVTECGGLMMTSVRGSYANEEKYAPRIARLFQTYMQEHVDPTFKFAVIEQIDDHGARVSAEGSDGHDER